MINSPIGSPGRFLNGIIINTEKGVYVQSISPSLPFIIFFTHNLTPFPTKHEYFHTTFPKKDAAAYDPEMAVVGWGMNAGANARRPSSTAHRGPGEPLRRIRKTKDRL